MRRRRIRSQAGFTLIELLVVVIIIGILAAIALPNFIGAQDKAREASVKANMRTCQIAAESYATDHAGNYPTIDQIKPYYPGGESTDNGKAGNPSVNPFNSAAEWPVPGAVSDVQATRNVAPDTLGDPGSIEYSTIASTSGGSGAPTSYAIRGAGKSKKALAGLSNGTTLVLSNQ